MRQPTKFVERRGIASYGLTFELPGAQHWLRSGTLMLRVRVEQPVENHDENHLTQTTFKGNPSLYAKYSMH